jgi:hypothetical protein
VLLGPVQRQIKFAQTRRAELDRLPAVVEEVRFATDSPLEGDGFEPSVPHQKGNAFRDSTVQLDPSQAGVPWDAI